jgi:hypothetical protein
MQYFPQESPPRAVTVMQSAAPADYTGPLPGPTTTVTFADGLGRAIEVNKTAVVDAVPGMISSGLVERDLVGRVVRTQNPFFTATASAAFISPQVTEATTTAYDALDRPVLTTYPDGATERASFDVTADPSGTVLFLARAIDPNGHARETYTDYLGRTRTFVEHPTTATSSVTRYVSQEVGN